jgi:8-oxo-dGTP pyrophosphatase MutT (NUDIX family)
MNYRLSVSILVPRYKKILVVSSRKWGGFSLPGGKVDPGETFEQAARRELVEETGCEALKLVSLGAVEHEPVATDPNRNRWLCMCYTAEIGNQEPKQNEEGTIPRWVSPQDVSDQSLYRDFTRGLLDRAGISWRSDSTNQQFNEREPNEF